MDLSLGFGQQIFLIFFAVFWGGIASVYGRYKPFGWLSGGRNLLRILVAIFLLDIFPILSFVFVLWILGRNPWKISVWDFENGTKIILVVLTAFGIFGPYRIWIGLVQQWPRSFYTEERIERLRCREPDDVNGLLAVGNFVWGVAYLLTGLAAALIIPALHCLG
jgi:hypothetical protein